jgi:sporulation integral membrane protein YlbJ
MDLTNKKATKERLFSFIFGILALLAFSLFLLRSDIAIDYMKKGLKLCALTVIPSLFPFMVISELLVSSGAGNKIGKLFAPPLRLILGVGEGCACAFVLGAVCGFPIGAKTLVSMLDRGEINQKEASRAMIFCNNPGAAFVISAVGTSLFKSFRLGVMLYCCVILSALTVGIFCRLFNVKNATASYTFVTTFQKPRRSIVEHFTSAVQSSALSMLTVCAYVSFFSSFIGCLGVVLESFGASKTLTALTFGFFEISSGVGVMSELAPHSAILLCAAVLGWSGLSVHFQIMTVAAGRGISFKPYFIAKSAQGIVCAMFMAVAMKLFPFSEEVFEKISVPTTGSAYSNAAKVCFIFFFASILPIILGKMAQNQCKKSKLKFF